MKNFSRITGRNRIPAKAFYPSQSNFILHNEHIFRLRMYNKRRDEEGEEEWQQILQPWI